MVKTKKIKISIIVPVYNVEKYINKCLDSLVNQTLKDIEIIVVNDGSPDNSQKIIDKYVKKYPKLIKSYIKENGGLGSARNFGLEKCSGEFVSFIDSDDYVDLDMFKKLYEKAISEKTDIVACKHYCVNENTEKKWEDCLYCKEDHFFDMPAVWNKIYKRDIIINNNIKFKEKVWYEDLAFTFKVYTYAKKIEFIEEPLYYYLIREGSIMNNSKIERIKEIFLAFDDLSEFLKNNKIYDKYYDYLEFSAIENILIAAIVRVINNSDKKNMNKNIDLYINYMNTNFPTYKKNKYIGRLNWKKKLIYNLVIHKKYNLIKFIFKLKNR